MQLNNVAYAEKVVLVERRWEVCKYSKRKLSM
jgi:hypothetical protein